MVPVVGAIGRTLQWFADAYGQPLPPAYEELGWAILVAGYFTWVGFFIYYDVTRKDDDE